MLENRLRQHYQQWFLEPIAKAIQNFSSPLAITVLACLSGILILPALYLHHAAIALILLITTGFLDTLDGTIARLKNQCSDIGTMFDIISDRIVECAIIIGFYLYAPQQRSLSCLILLATIFLCVTSFLVVGIFTKNQSQKSFYYNSALIERFEAFIFFALMICLPHYFNLLSYSLSFLVLLTMSQHCLKLTHQEKA
jgi:phosphatidylglycerophosphate synthase